MNLKKIAELYAVTATLTGYVMTLRILLLCWLNPDRILEIKTNAYGEALPETLFFLFSLPCVAYHIYDKYRH